MKYYNLKQLLKKEQIYSQYCALVCTNENFFYHIRGVIKKIKFSTNQPLFVIFCTIIRNFDNIKATVQKIDLILKYDLFILRKIKNESTPYNIKRWDNPIGAYIQVQCIILYTNSNNNQQHLYNSANFRQYTS